jgi:hypothetical protein
VQLYHIGQRVEGLKGGTITGVIVAKTADNGGSEGPGLITVDVSPPHYELIEGLYNLLIIDYEWQSPSTTRLNFNEWQQKRMADYDARKKALDAQATVPPLNNALKLSTYINLSESLAIEVRLFLLVLRFLPLSLLLSRGKPTLMTTTGGMVTFTTSAAPSSASLLSLRTRTLTQCHLHGSVTV